MASFVVMEPPLDRATRDELIVRDGFHWLGFFLPLLWFLWHRLWIEAAVVLDGPGHQGQGLAQVADVRGDVGGVKAVIDGGAGADVPATAARTGSTSAKYLRRGDACILLLQKFD